MKIELTTGEYICGQCCDWVFYRSKDSKLGKILKNQKNNYYAEFD